MNRLRKVVSILTALVMMTVVVPVGLFEQPVYAATDHAVSSWAEIYALRDSTGVIRDKNITLTNDITLPVNVDVVSEMVSSTFDGNGHIINIPNNAILEYESSSYKTHNGIALFGKIHDTTFENVMFKAAGDVHIGMDQTINDTYHLYDPHDLYDFGLVFSAVTYSSVSNVAVVGNTSSSTFHVRMEGAQNIPMNVGLISGISGERAHYSGIYIDMNLKAGIRSDDAVAYGGLLTGRVYFNNSNYLTKHADFYNFQIQGKIEIYSGKGSGAICGGAIGAIETFGKSDAGEIYDVNLYHGIVDADTYSYDFAQGIDTPNYSWALDALPGLRGAVIGNENEHYDSILLVSSVTSKLNNYQNSFINLSEISKLPTVNTIPTIEPITSDWISTNNGSGIGDVTLMWLVNPENEMLAISLDDDTFQLTSGKDIYAEKNGGRSSWEISAEMMLKGALGTINSVTVNKNLGAPDVTAEPIYYRENALPTYYPGGDYYFGIAYTTENIGSNAPAISWKVDATSAASGVTIPNGVLTIPDTVDAGSVINITATITLSASVSKDYFHSVTVVDGSYVDGTLSAKPATENKGNTDKTNYFIVPPTVNETTVEYSTNNADWSELPAGGLDITSYVTGSASLVYLRRVPVDDTDTFHFYATSPSSIFTVNSATAGLTTLTSDSTSVAQTPANLASVDSYTLLSTSSDLGKATFTVQDLFSSNPLRNNGIARGDIKIEVKNNNKYSYRTVDFSSTGYSYIGVSGGAIERPTISPSANINTNTGLEIQHPDSGADIYYTTDGSIPSDTSTRFVSGNNIPVTTIPFTLKAVAYVGGVQGSVASMDITADKLADPPQATISAIGGSQYSQTDVYDRNDIIAFSPPIGYSTSDGNGEIKYIVNPSPGQNAIDHGTVYNVSTPPVVPDVSVRTVTVQVAYVDTSVTNNSTGGRLRLNSDIATYTITLNTTASHDIIANRSPSTHQLPNTVVHLSLPESELSQINSDNVEALTYSGAQEEDQKLLNLYSGTSVTVTIDDDNLDEDVSRYISYEFDVEYEDILYVPEIRYSHSVGTPSTPSSSSLLNYAYARRIVEETYTTDADGVSSLTEVEVSYTKPTDIVLRGDPLDQYTIFAQVRSTGSIGVLDSEIAVFEYTIADSVKPVVMTPNPNDVSIEFNENTQIALDTDTSGAIIFYSVNADARVNYNDSTNTWEPEDGTIEYTSYFRLGSSFHSTVVNTIAVSPNNSLQPIENTFYLTVTALPKANPPTPALASGSTVVSGDTLRFLNDSTLITGEIYYTLDSSEPDAEGYVNWITNNPGVDPPDNNVNGTYKYDENTGITAAFSPGESVITIVAVSRDASPLKTQSNSDPVRIQYFIQAADAPTSIPESTADNIPIVTPGTSILLFSRTSDASIFYTTDGTEPKFTITPTIDPITGVTTNVYTPAIGSTTKLVGVDDPPVMPFGSQAFFTVRAIAVAEDYIQSTESRLLFQPPAPVQPVSPSVSHLQPVARNTALSFTSSTEGASIIYKTYDTLAEAKADAVDSNGDPVLMNSTNGTLYSANTPLILNRDTVIRVVAEKDNVQSVELFYEYTIAPQLSNPALSISNGSIIYPGAVINITGDSNGEISYTTNGDDPKAADPADLLYGSSYVVTADYGETVTVKVISTAQGYTPSDTQVYSYTVCKEEDYLTTTPTNEENIKSNSVITLSTTITNGQIYYTTDNSSPTVGGLGGSSAETIIATGEPGGTFTVKAVVSAMGATPGNVVVSTFRMSEKTPAPTASIPTGAITLDGAYVTLAASEGTIYYTTDGEDPTTSSAIYENPISANRSMVLKAIAIEDDKEPSEIVSYIYTRAGDTAAPEFSTNGGSIEQNSTITLTTDTIGAQIYYTTSGESPQSDRLENATLYNGPITVSAAVTIRAIAIAEGLHASVVSSSTFTVIEPPLPPSEDDDGNLPNITSSDRLASRRTYDNTEGGPLYEDTVMTDEINNIVVSAPEDVLDEEAQLHITSFEPSQKQRDVVNELGYDLQILYEIEFIKDTAATDSNGDFEIGLPIDSIYQNGTIVIYRINDDGTVAPFAVRRSGGLAYAVVDEPGVYAVGIPMQSETLGTGLFGWIQNIWNTLMMLI